MKYFYSKYKFTHSLFYKSIELATVEHTDKLFSIQIYPFFAYGGRYYIESVVKKDNERTIFLTKKSRDEKFDSENYDFLEQFFVSLSHDGRKVMIFKEGGEGIIIKG